MKSKKHHRQCLNCRKYIGWSLQPLKNQLEVCGALCQQKLNKKLDKQLNQRIESREQNWQEINQGEEEELIFFTQNQYQTLINKVEKLEKNQSSRGLVNDISKVLSVAKKNNLSS